MVSSLGVQLVQECLAHSGYGMAAVDSGLVSPTSRLPELARPHLPPNSKQMGAFQTVGNPIIGRRCVNLTWMRRTAWIQMPARALLGHRQSPASDEAQH